MLTLLHSLSLIIVMFAFITLALGFVQRRYPARKDAVIDAVDALLPQTQCAQCGYPGCRPYAEALVNGADLDLCPPGGASTQAALALLLGREPGTVLKRPEAVRAQIDETLCVGCFLCVEACPVDAIVGAPRFMHTVIAERCTGCELCVPPCPMDCIELLPVAQQPLPALPDDAAPCIRCNRCEPVCPESLQPQTLWWYSRNADLSQAMELGLNNCIECGLCNSECPSGIDLVAVFTSARATLALGAEGERLARQVRRDHEQRTQRLLGESLIASDRRQARMSAPVHAPENG